VRRFLFSVSSECDILPARRRGKPFRKDAFLWLYSRPSTWDDDIREQVSARLAIQLYGSIQLSQ
jgi:hypothetical protein